MKKTIVATGLAALLVPAFALAQDDHMGPPPPPGGQGTFNGAAHVQFQGGGAEGDVQFQGAGMMQGEDQATPRPGEGEQGDWRGPASGTPMMYASDTPYMRGEKYGIEDRYGSTTPPGMMASGTRPEFMRDEASSSQESRFQYFFPMFFHWLFGAPASTTVGDLRAQIEASSTASASSSGQLPPPPAREQNQNEGDTQGAGGFIQALFRSLGSIFGR